MKYCSHCGGPVQTRVPAGDHFQRAVCDHCGRIHYRNPKVVVGCIPVRGKRIIMCRRAIEPRLGYWTFPAGFLELGETAAEGAAREALEETGVGVDIENLLAVLDIPQVGQIYMAYRARARDGEPHPTEESSEAVFMCEDEIPWGEIAFPSIHESLKFFFADRAAGRDDIHTLDLRGARLGKGRVTA